MKLNLQLLSYYKDLVKKKDYFYATSAGRVVGVNPVYKNIYIILVFVRSGWIKR